MVTNCGAEAIAFLKVSKSCGKERRLARCLRRLFPNLCPWWVLFHHEAPVAVRLFLHPHSTPL